MNIFKVSAKDLKVLYFIRPPFMLLLCYVLFGAAYFKNITFFTIVTAVSLVVTAISWRLHIEVDHFLRKIISQTQHPSGRISFSLLVHFIIGAIFVTTIVLLADIYMFLDYQLKMNNYLTALLVSLCTNLAATVFHEGVYIFENWEKIVTEAENLKKLSLKKRLNNLRNQMSPHFFFNSINTLSSLIELDTKKADLFLNKLSLIYRYLLLDEQDKFLPLSNEIAFIRSWMDVVETRYAPSIKFIIIAATPFPESFISRLTLLSFLGNILDTYVIDRKNTLHVTLNIKEDKIVITHPIKKIKPSSLNRKDDQIKETKIIHKLLGLPAISESEHEGTKSIIIPLH